MVVVGDLAHLFMPCDLMISLFQKFIRFWNSSDMDGGYFDSCAVSEHQTTARKPTDNEISFLSLHKGQLNFTCFCSNNRSS